MMDRRATQEEQLLSPEGEVGGSGEDEKELGEMDD